MSWRKGGNRPDPEVSCYLCHQICLDCFLNVPFPFLRWTATVVHTILSFGWANDNKLYRQLSGPDSMPGDTFQMVKFSLLKTPSFTSESWRSGLELQLEIARESTLHLFLQQRPLVPWNFSSYMASWTYCRIFSCISSAEYMPPKTVTGLQ